MCTIKPYKSSIFCTLKNKRSLLDAFCMQTLHSRNMVLNPQTSKPMHKVICFFCLLPLVQVVPSYCTVQLHLNPSFRLSSQMAPFLQGWFLQVITGNDIFFIKAAHFTSLNRPTSQKTKFLMKVLKTTFSYMNQNSYTKKQRTTEKFKCQIYM